jgi:mannonate dehydratase
MIWNMIYDSAAAPGAIPSCTSEELWERVKVFLNVLLPVAEESGITLAAHPDDPPLPEVRGTPRLVYQPHLYKQLIDINRSPNNQLEFCLGTIAEMSEGDVYSATQCYASQKRIAYIHFRNVRGKVPNYVEAFVDDGDIDMRRIVRILRENKFEGVLIPDHTPLPECPGAWYAGMAYAMGYMRCALQEIGIE